MAHIVNRRGYLSLEESYRDENGKPRKRYLKYIGKRSSDPQARMAQMLDTAERKAEEWDSFQRAEFGETALEKRAREEDEARFAPQTFLEETTGPAPSETEVDNTGTSPSEAMDTQPDAPSSETDAGPSGV